MRRIGSATCLSSADADNVHPDQNSAFDPVFAANEILRRAQGWTALRTETLFPACQSRMSLRATVVPLSEKRKALAPGSALFRLPRHPGDARYASRSDC